MFTTSFHSPGGLLPHVEKSDYATNQFKGSWNFLRYIRSRNIRFSTHCIKFECKGIFQRIPYPLQITVSDAPGRNLRLCSISRLKSSTIVLSIMIMLNGNEVTCILLFSHSIAVYIAILLQNTDLFFHTRDQVVITLSILLHHIGF